MESLYELTTQYRTLLDFDVENEDDAQAFELLLTELSSDIHVKAVNIGYVIKAAEQTCDVIKGEEDRLRDRRKRAENKIERLKSYLKTGMETTGVLDVKDPVMPIKVVKNPPSCVVDYESKVPDKYLIPQPPKIDKAGIKKALSDGETLDFAHLERSTRLKIG